MIESIVLEGFTTQDISGVPYVRRLALSVQSWLGISELSVLRLIHDDGKMDMIPFNHLSDSEIARLYIEGSIALRAEDGTVAAGLQWFKIAPGRGEDLTDPAAFLQNQIKVSLLGDQLKHPEFRRKFVSLAKQLAVDFGVNFLRVHDWISYDAAFVTSLNLGEGLHDIYWLTVFGAPYCRLIGEEVLLRLPCYSSQLLKQGMVMIQLSEEFEESVSDSGRALRMRAKIHIGEEYFAKKSARDTDLGSGVVNIFNVYKMFLAFRKRRKPTIAEVIADKVPVFDFSKMK